MAKEKSYKLAFRGLKEGTHEFCIVVDDEFIELFDIADFSHPAIEVRIVMVKRENMLEVEISGRGTVRVTCDRCLDQYDQDITFSDTIIVKTDAAKSEIIDEALIHVALKDEELDLSQYLYESVSLSVPIKRVHGTIGGKSGCNSEMEKRLKPSKTNKKLKTVDPRWDALKNLEF